MEQIEGFVEGIIYCNEQNGYTVCELRSGRRIITAVGCMPGLCVGETVLVGGLWVVHQDYGKQLKVESCERRLPKTTDAILKYLSSGVIKGIGEATAKKIVAAFVDETLRVLQFEPLRLTKIKGISTDKALAIGQTFAQQEQIRLTIMFFQEYGISANMAVKLWKKFGSQAIDEIKRNPYRLTDEDFNIGFKTADRVAISMGIDPSSKFRVQSGIKHALSKAVQNGHVYLPRDILVDYASRLLGTTPLAVEEALSDMMFEESIYVDKAKGDRVYLAAFYKAEQYVCRKIGLLYRTQPEKDINDLNGVLKEIEAEQQVQYAQLQLDAIRLSAEKSILVVTGGPGTGKTTLIKGIIALFQKEGLKVVLAAPTGRAAKRMTEATGEEAKTIHRLLETVYADDEFKKEFKKNEQDPIEADIIIIDEVSMVDILLMHALLKAVQPGTRLVLVGDADQLPSVGPGRILSDMIESGLLEVAYLNQIFRQAEESLIVVNAHRINQGECPEMNRPDSDFFFVPRVVPQDAAAAVLELCTVRIPEKFGLDPMKDIQVLSPAKRGAAGVFSLNAALQARLNPPSANRKEKASRDMVFREGDRVMQIKNNYTLSWTSTSDEGIQSVGEGVFNGDMGIVRAINPKDSTLTVLFDDGKVAEYDFENLDELELSYAITVHKSQGSEFPAVVISLAGIPSMLTCRNLLYTAVTRAKQLVVLVGDMGTIQNMIANMTEKERYTGLKERLAEENAGMQAGIVQSFL
ncbi:MAG: ATP-dependent RecD-like DNA helicase [Ruminiclostridium sp.]|nr:ATP-dependent RecD-like DNA helicase [Ruminiclostridium sp.]